MPETELEMVRRHVRDGENVVARQFALVQALQNGGHDSRAAEELLAMFRWTLASHYEHLSRLQP